MSSSDLFTADYPHGTPTGYDDGCRGGACPGGDQWGLTCKRAKQLSRSDYRYQQLAKENLTPAEIADKLGLIPQVGETRGKPPTKPKKPTGAAAPTGNFVPKVWMDGVGATDETIAEFTATTTKTDAPDADETLTPHPPTDTAPKPPTETHDLGAPTATTTAEADTDVPEAGTIVPEPDGHRPDWSHVTLTEDLARAQTERDALAEELAETKGELTRARGLVARLEEELARANQEHAAEISALHAQLSDNHNGDRQRIQQLEESLALAESTANADDTIADLTTRLAAAEVDLAQAYSAVDAAVAAHVTDAETIRRLSSALELALRKWAAERERGDCLAEVVAEYKWVAQQRREENQRRIDQILNSVPAPATPDDDSTPPLGLADRIRRGWAITR